MSPEHLHALARRLRTLRTTTWPGTVITQRQLADALGLEESTSVPLISSWESTTNPRVPPDSRLDAYARFFATPRSVSGRAVRLLTESELTGQELVRRDELLSDLRDLATAARSRDGAEQPAGSALGGFWRFPPAEIVTVVCAELPEEMRLSPYAASPDEIRLHRFADADALLELYGHLRATNPTTSVNIRIASEPRPSDYTTHLVVIGGVDWNVVTRELMRHIELPIYQLPRQGDSDFGGFEVGDQPQIFTPRLEMLDDQKILVEDVAHFYRGPNPFNTERTVTICNGMFALGTLGAIRALTDPMLRDRNEEYLKSRFAGADTFSIISRVPILNGTVVTPDWTVPKSRLHEWAEGRGAHEGTQVERPT